MDPQARSRIKDILEMSESLDRAADAFCKLMLQPSDRQSRIDPYVEIKPAETARDILITAHRVQCIAKYVHVLHETDLESPLKGKYELHIREPDGRLGDRLITLHFDKHGRTDRSGNAQSFIVEPTQQCQTREAFLLYFIDAIQRSLDRPAF